MEIDKIYVLHHLPLVERGENLRKRLADENIEYEMVTKYLPNEIDYEKEIKDWDKTETIEIIHPYGSYLSVPFKVSLSVLSLLLKHQWCYKQQIENGYENVLILEDDIIVPHNFKTYLDNNMKDFTELYETENVTMLMMGISHNRHTKAYKAGKWAHYGINQKSRCSHAYVMNIDASIKMIKHFYPIDNPLDFKLDSTIAKENIKVAWSEPGIMQNFDYKSSLER